MLDACLLGLTSLLEMDALLPLLLGTFLGVVVGFIPGLGGNFLLAILIPFTFKMTPVAAFALLLASHSLITTGGSVSAILFNTPGSGMNAATVLDGFPMTQRGKAGEAVGAAITASMVGGIIGVIALLAVIPVMKPVVLAFGAPEFFMLTMLGISVISSLGGKPSKGLLMGFLGLIISLVGQDPISGQVRFTFGQMYLWNGIKIIPVVLGIFAIGEMIHLGSKGGSLVENATYVSHKVVRDIKRGCVAVFRHFWLTLRCSLIGIVIGFLPGLGGEAAGFFCYGHALQSSKNKDAFGKGAIEGVIAPEAANNSKEGGCLIPTIGFGIPGTSAMAILLGVFMIHGIVPGAQMFTDKLDLTFSMAWTVALANIIGGFALLPLTTQITRLVFLRGSLIVPIILMFAMLGSYSYANHFGDIMLAAIFGAFGYLVIKRLKYPPAPLLIGLVLGRIAETNLQISLKLFGWKFLLQPYAFIMVLLLILSLSLPIIKLIRGKSEKAIRETNKGDLYFIIFACGLLLILFFSAMGYKPIARTVPIILIIPAFALAFFRLIPNLAALRTKPRELHPQPVKSPDHKTQWHKVAGMISWCFVMVLGIWLLGFILSMPLLVLLYLRFHREKWPITLTLSALVFVFLKGLFTMVLKVHLYQGYIPDLLMRHEIFYL